MTRNEIIKNYFSKGLSYKEIRCLLVKCHNIFVSQCNLKRLINGMGFYRKLNFSDENEVRAFINMQLDSSCHLHGYRWMFQKCVQHGLVTTQHKVRRLLRLLDPKGVENRARRKLKRHVIKVPGPNYMWHMDSYDKLKPFGICINGCIDGYSRKIIWMEAYLTSSDPKVIGSYYVKAIKKHLGCPRIMRSDMGTENGHVEEMHRFLRRNGTDTQSQNCFFYGRSTANQRIEFWWSILRKESSQFWINLFHQLKNDGDFTCNQLDKSILQFCFLNMLQVDIFLLCFTLTSIYTDMHFIFVVIVFTCLCRKNLTKWWKRGMHTKCRDRNLRAPLVDHFSFTRYRNIMGIQITSVWYQP